MPTKENTKNFRLSSSLFIHLAGNMLWGIQWYYQ